MCDEVNRAEKSELQAAAHEDAAMATPQVAAAATATPQVTARKDADSKKVQVVDPEFARAENEDDDGYDPYSDRRPVSEPLFERDPWS
ncbi:MAG: hypothetical protein HXK28_03020 [Atopobium sp.]|nr:hypothetical protein [Atopobium sp.]